MAGTCSTHCTFLGGYNVEGKKLDAYVYVRDYVCFILESRIYACRRIDVVRFIKSYGGSPAPLDDLVDKIAAPQLALEALAK
jgi:hypothetical protein